MTFAEPQYGASFSKKFSQASPEDLLRRIREENPTADAKTERRLFRTAVLEDPDMIDACINWVWVSAGRNLNRFEETASPEEKRERRKSAAAERSKRVKRAVRATFNALAEKVAELTFGEIAKIGKYAKKFAGLGKPNERIGDKLSMAEISKRLR